MLHDHGIELWVLMLVEKLGRYDTIVLHITSLYLESIVTRKCELKV
jgi:hypothetical protein